MTKNNKRIIILSVFALLSMVLFLAITINTYWPLVKDLFGTPYLFSSLSKVLRRRFLQMIAIIVSVVLISLSSLSFQTLTNNRILTPSILGFDAIFVITQTMLVALFGGLSIYITNDYLNFGVTTIVMVLVIMLMFVAILRKKKNNIILLLLLGLVISQLASSMSNFIRVFMNPDDFQNVVSLTNVNINTINENLVLMSLPLMVILTILFFREHRYYDVMSLGEDKAINLGVDYNKKANLTLIYITISMAVSTALVGPLSFLGLIVVNSAKELFKTTKHKTLMFGSSLLAIIILLGGQALLELINFKTPVTVIVSLIGGIYLIYILIKENLK